MKNCFKNLSKVVKIKIKRDSYPQLLKVHAQTFAIIEFKSVNVFFHGIDPSFARPVTRLVFNHIAILVLRTIYRSRRACLRVLIRIISWGSVIFFHCSIYIADIFTTEEAKPTNNVRICLYMHKRDSLSTPIVCLTRPDHVQKTS